MGGGQRDRRTLAGDTHQSRETSVNTGVKKRMEREKSALSDVAVNISFAYSILRITRGLKRRSWGRSEGRKASRSYKNEINCGAL